jgi:hypothetical protein
MNEENFKAWLREMRTTDKAQTDGVLCRILDDGTKGYCCLGLGSLLVPGIHVEEVENGWMDDGEGGESEVYFGETAEKELAPIEFIDWLGITTAEESNNGYDVAYDWPADLTWQGVKSNQENRPLTPGGIGVNAGLCTAASLNDDGFTFEQIADIFEYFGIREQQ